MLSQPARAIMTLLELANVKFEAIDVGKMQGGLKGPEFA